MVKFLFDLLPNSNSNITKIFDNHIRILIGKSKKIDLISILKKNFTGWNFFKKRVPDNARWINLLMPY
jgi:hypothetical protein